MELADWRTLARVIKRSDGVIEVLDARDPLGTRSLRAEGIARAFGKKVIIAINKVDLIPKDVAKRWLDYFDSLGLRAVLVSSLRGYGKGTLKAEMLKVSSGGTSTFSVVGYPKTGKSSIINMFKGYRSASVSKVPGSWGHTKGYTIYRVAKDIYVIDTPGTIPVEGDELESIIRGRSPEELRDPVRPAVLLIERALRYNPNSIAEAYGVLEIDPYKILERIAMRRMWIYKSTHEPNIEEAARTVIRDYHRGKLWFYVPPP
jgi:hypothetical protein